MRLGLSLRLGNRSNKAANIHGSPEVTPPTQFDLSTTGVVLSNSAITLDDTEYAA